MISLVPFTTLLSAIADNRGKTCPTSENGVPLIATNCVKNSNLYPTYEKVRFVSEETYDSWFRAHPQPGDLIFVTKGSPGEVCFTPDPVDFCIAQDMVAIRADEAVVHPKYLFAALRAKKTQQDILNLHVGTMIPHFKKGDFGKLLIPLPDLQTQKSIGEAYYNISLKIANNRRMNETLEEMARAIFKSWFVDFDPVHAKSAGNAPAHMDADTAALFPSSFGDDGLPEGWSLGHLSDLVDLNPTERIKKGELSSYIEMANLPTSGSNISNVVLREFKSGTKFRNGDTLLARITPCLENGKTAYVDVLDEGEVAWGSTEYIVMRTKDPLPKFYSYVVARSEHFREHAIRSMTGTSGRQRAQADMVAAYEVVIPPKSVASAFGDIGQNWFSKIRCNAAESKTLAELRDTLLPKLMSGEIRVSDAEREVEAVV